MSALTSILVFCQALGAFVGATSAVWSELAYMWAMRDGRVNKAERAHLKSIDRGLRFGMSLLLLSSLGLVVSAFATDSALQPAFTESYWTLVVLALLVILVSWVMSRRYLSLAIGSAISFTAWWFLLYLTTGQLATGTVGTTATFFAIAAVLVFILLQTGRRISLSRR
ncbi:MAG: hypothetical protein WC030_00430 [Candidatus Paceibacterota bacterium]